MRQDVSPPNRPNPARLGSVQDRLAWQEAELAILQQVRSALTETGNIIQIIIRTVNSLVDLLGYGHVGAYLVEDGELQLVHQIGFLYPLQRLKLSAGVCGRVATTGRGVHLADVRQDPDYLAANDGIESEICVPFGVLGETRGVLNIESTSRAPLSDRDFKLTEEIAGLLSLAIERSELANANISVEQRLQAALDAASMGAWIWSVGADEWNWTFGERTYEPVKVLEQTFVTSDLLRLIDAADVPHVEHELRMMVETGDLDVDFRIMSTAGTAIWLNLRGHAIEWVSQRIPARIAGVVTDVSGRKRLEEERLRLVHLETARINAEEARQEMETTIGRLTDGFIAADADLRVTLINEPAADLLGLDRVAAIGASMVDLIADFATETGRKQLLESAMAPLPSSVDLYEPAQGKFIDTHIYPGSGGITIYLRDVTRLRQAEFERQRAESRFRSLVQQASDLTLVLDHMGTVTFCSPAIERILGYKPEELVGTVPKHLVQPADYKRLMSAFVRIARRHGIGQPFELRLTHKDGPVRWVEVTPTNLLTDASVMGIVVNCRDVSDRHQSEFQLWLATEVASVIGSSLDIETMLTGTTRLLANYLFDCALIAVEDAVGTLQHFTVSWRHDVAPTFDFQAITGPGLIEMVRSNRRQGLLAAEFATIRVPQLLAGPDPGPVAPLLERLQSAGIVVICPAAIVINGAVRGAILAGVERESPLAAGEVALVQDTARRAGLALSNAELYEGARKAIATRDRFLSVAAHELRTPITSVTGYTEMLQREIAARKDPGRIERYVGRLTDAGHRLASLADDLLDVSRLRGSGLTLRRGPVDLAAEVNRLASGFVERGEISGDRVHVTIAGEPSTIEGDAERLEQVITNLMTNAIKYSRASREPVRIDLRSTVRNVVLSVADRGIGVDSASLNGIFEPFGRAQNAVDSEVPGLGLGLYIARAIVERHGGTIEAKSDGPGSGLTVTVSLPREPAAA